MKANASWLYFLLFVLVVSVFLFNGSAAIINLHPESVHHWRQSDCAAYIKMFYRTGDGLFQPATFNLAGHEGRMASEFPVLYFIAARLRHITGADYAGIRMLTFVFSMLGVFYTFALTRFSKGDLLTRIWLPLLLLTSPLFYYYALNFLPNASAIGCGIAGLYYFISYLRGAKQRSLIWGTAFTTLAVLLKPTDGGLLWVALSCAVLFLSRRNIFEKTRIYTFLGAGILIAILLSLWVWYVKSYNMLNGNHQNLVGILPAWHMDWDDIRNTLLRIWYEWRSVYHYWLILLLIVILMIIALFNWKKLDTLLRTLTLFTWLGCLVYFILFYGAFYHHDYYQLIFILPPLITLLAFQEFYSKLLFRHSAFTLINILILTLLIPGTVYNRHIQQQRYADPLYLMQRPQLFSMEPFLDSLGVTKDKIVVVPTDISGNITLNAINRRGYTEVFAGEVNNRHTFDIGRFMRAGAGYMILPDTTRRNEPYIKPYTQHLLGSYEGIEVYQLKN